MMVHTCHPRYYGGKYKIGRLWSRLAWRKQDSISKITRAKRAGHITQAVETLPSEWVQTPIVSNKTKQNIDYG
jgi:hypothetical protein